MQGLLYDALRTADSAGLHVAQARCFLRPPGRASIQLFLRTTQLEPLADDALLRGLLFQLRNAITHPLTVAVCVPRPALRRPWRTRDSGAASAFTCNCHRSLGGHTAVPNAGTLTLSRDSAAQRALATARHSGARAPIVWLQEQSCVQVMPSEAGVLDVLVVTPMDSGQRGRPRVARDVTAVLASEPLRIDAAFIGAVGDCADQGRVPGDVLHEMMSSLQLPHMQVRLARVSTSALCPSPRTARPRTAQSRAVPPVSECAWGICRGHSCCTSASSRGGCGGVCRAR